MYCLLLARVCYIAQTPMLLVGAVTCIVHRCKCWLLDAHDGHSGPVLVLPGGMRQLSGQPAP